MHTFGPACKKLITADERHKPATQHATLAHVVQHFGHKWGKIPLVLRVEPVDAVPDTLHGFLRSVVNMFFVSVNMNLNTLDESTRLVVGMEHDLKVETKPVHLQRNRESKHKVLQTWNGKECWRILRGIGQILDKVFHVRDGEHGSTAMAHQHNYARCSTVFQSFVELMAAWILNAPEDPWQQVALLMRDKAQFYRDTFVLAAG